MTAQPTDGLHVLRNAWTQRSFMAEHCRALAAGLEDAIRATRLATPHRPRRGKDFCIDSASHVGRKGLEEIDPKSEERRIEALLYQAYGPTGLLGPTDSWERLVAFQVPLFEEQQRNDWGHIDLLALGADGRPIVVELKKHDSVETPLRILIEGLANAIALEENWPALSQEIRAMCARKGLRSPVADTAAPVTVAGLAPDAYWRSWQADGTAGRTVKSSARDEFRRLRAAVAEAGYPVRLETFDWPFDGDPRVRPAEVDW